MAVIALASVKGAPGVTTTALALGSVWPVERAVVVAELDPAGGDIAARHDLAAEPSVVSLAAALRRDHDRGATRVLDHIQQLPGGLRVLSGSPAPAEMRSAIEVLGDALPSLAGAELDVLVDCGRVGGASVGSAPEPTPSQHSGPTPISRLLRRADLVVVVTGGTLADLSHVECAVPELRAFISALAVIVVGRLSWRVEEIASALGVEVLGHLPDDPAAAAVIGGQAHRGSPGRLPLLRAARDIADHIVGRLGAGHAHNTSELSGALSSLRQVAASEAAP